MEGSGGSCWVPIALTLSLSSHTVQGRDMQAEGDPRIFMSDPELNVFFVLSHLLITSSQLPHPKIKEE